MRWDVFVAALTLPACLLSIPPMLVQIQARNFATTVLVLGTLVLNLSKFVNALIWPNNDSQQWWDGRIYCDVQVKLSIGLEIAVLGALVSLLRQMAHILRSDGNAVNPTPRQKAHKLAFELTFCVLMPLVLMAGHYVVQPERYRIRSIVGCRASFDNSWLGILIMVTWPIFAYLLGGFYCVVSMLRLWRHKRQTASVLSIAPTASRSRLAHLFNLACIISVAYIPLAIYNLSQNWSVGLHPFDWDQVHPPNWKDQIYKMPRPGAIPIDCWVQIGSGYLCFVFLGLGHDATELYASWREVASLKATRLLLHLRRS